jgi:hypothetical protein
MILGNPVTLRLRLDLWTDRFADSRSETGVRPTSVVMGDPLFHDLLSYRK